LSEVEGLLLRSADSSVEKGPIKRLADSGKNIEFIGVIPQGYMEIAADSGARWPPAYLYDDHRYDYDGDVLCDYDCPCLLLLTIVRVRWRRSTSLP
jgi:hypothetical protein